MASNYIKNHWVILLVTVMAASVFAADSSEVISNNPEEINLDTKPAVKLYNPLWAGLGSAIIPGAGQVYTKKYFKAGTFVALEAITASVAGYQYKTYRKARNSYTDLMSGLGDIERPFDRACQMEDALLKYGEAREAKITMYNTLSWMIGGYVFNVLDAVNSTNFFKNNETRNPHVAGWLAAIPGLGLGHIYNGSYSKAGLVIMTQISLGFVAYNKHKLMREAEDHISRFIKMEKSLKDENAVNKPDSVTKVLMENVLKENYRDEWESRQNSAFRSRNSYLWYSLFFYLYGIVDVVVDAHLHDYKEKMKLYPDLMPTDDGIHLQINYNF
ncbi:MAG: DUF5683 domain-containing protein [Fibrobacter sp.]|nr:DUF5683 domain-containing protein [Fibrobacter sp.]